MVRVSEAASDGAIRLAKRYSVLSPKARKPAQDGLTLTPATTTFVVARGGDMTSWFWATEAITFREIRCS
jgi:hypothetical protein